MLFSDLEIYKLLDNVKKEDREKMEVYKSCIPLIESNMRTILPDIRIKFPDYPDHGIDHSYRILKHIYKIFNDKMKNTLSALDILVIILAACFHDAGMALFTEEKYTKDEIRQKHHLLSKQVIDIYFEKNLQGLPDSNRIKNAVIFVCEAHGFTLDELLSDNRINKNDCIDGLTIHYGILAFLLRIGDLLDLEGDRTNVFRMFLFSETYCEVAKDHNERHLNVDEFNATSDSIVIKAIAENYNQYKIWADWFSFLVSDIEKFDLLYASMGLLFPIPQTSISRPDGALYEAKTLKFEIDNNGGIWDIFSKSVYTNDLDFLRELIQNAIDASLKKIYLDDNILIENPSPRDWGKKAEEIMVCYSESMRLLYVIDYGIGMNYEDLNKFLFKVSSSGGIQNDNRDFVFPGIAQYGIGFVSCLVNADDIEIYTTKSNKEINSVVIESGKNYAFLEKKDNKYNYVGTTIVLNVKHNFKFEEIENYLSNHFRFPSVKVKLIELDRMYGLFKESKKEKDFEEILKNPFCLKNIHERNQAIFTKKRNELLYKRREINKSLEIFYELELFFEDYSNNPEINRKTFYKKFNDMVKEFIDSERDSRINELLKSVEITEEMQRKNAWYDVYDMMLEKLKNIQVLIQEENRVVSEESRKYIDYFRSIGRESIDLSDDWKYIFIEHEANQVKNIICFDSAEIIKGKEGILLVKHCESDYKLGIEYVTINGFYVVDGVICRTIKSKSLDKVMNRFDKKRRMESSSDDVNENTNDPIRIEFEHFSHYPYSNSKSIKGIHEEIIDENSVPVNNNDEKMISKKLDQIYNNLIFSSSIYQNNKLEFLSQLDEENDKSRKKKRIDSEIQDVIRQNKVINDIKDIITIPKDAYYQDGILIPFQISKLFPIGFSRIVCNCTYNSRMKLNVTRHNPSELREDVSSWLNSTGREIQYKMVKGLMEDLEHLGIKLDFKDTNFWEKGREGEYLEFMARNSFRQAVNSLKEKK